MQHLTLKNISYTYPDASTQILNNITLQFNKGWSSIIGVNGSGKSTILKLISKRLTIQEGTIEGNSIVYYCRQSTEFPPEGLKGFLESYHKNAFVLKEIFNVHDMVSLEWDKLSHGERKRLQVAVALYVQSDILLIDEPTNHLDTLSQQMIFTALKNYRGIGILISHDRMLLEKLTDMTTFLKEGKVQVFKCSYSDACQAYDKELTYLSNRYNEQKKEINKLKRSIQRQKEVVSQTKKRFSKKGLALHDKDARTKIDLAKLTGKDRKSSQKVTSLLHKQSKLNNNIVHLDKVYDTGITMESNPVGIFRTIEILQNDLTLNKRINLKYPRLEIKDSDKIGIIGNNGVGKSTFIVSIINQYIFAHNYLYIPQELTISEIKEIFSEVSSLPNKDKSKIYTMVRKLSSDPIKIANSILPSQGEIRKLLLAKGILEEPSLIILDEPTNHMDLESMISISEALIDYKGALLVISHDHVFLDSFTNKVWEFVKTSDTSCTLQETLK